MLEERDYNPEVGGAEKEQLKQELRIAMLRAEPEPRVDYVLDGLQSGKVRSCNFPGVEVSGIRRFGVALEALTELIPDAREQIEVTFKDRVAAFKEVEADGAINPRFAIAFTRDEEFVSEPGQIRVNGWKVHVGYDNPEI